MKKIKMRIQTMRERNKLKAIGRKIPYLNKPIENADYDEIGMNVYVNYLESAIEQGASMISVVSRFGTGKSSLIELLKQKYHGVEVLNGKKYKRTYCQVNLWNQMDNGEGSAGLHRTFLYQMIASIRPELGSYFSRRTSRNFGVLKLNTNKPWRDAGIVMAVILFVIVTVAYTCSDIVIDSGVLNKEAFHTLILAGYAICIAAFVLLALRAEVTFSSKNSEGNRRVEENELIDMYRENILRPRRWYRLPFEKLIRRKHYVVVIEDLDRTTDGESVYHFLQELRKYYVPADQLEQTFRNQITFVVNIMPEDVLRSRCSKGQCPDEYVYEKMFDYSLNLNRINIDNFDSILEGLIQEKREELTEIGLKVQEKNNVHDIEGMQWIIHGKSLTLRDVKVRLNDAVLLYESLRSKFGEEYADFEKCAVTAYLRNAYSDSFYQLTDDILEQMLNWYATDMGDAEVFLGDFGKCRGIYSDEFLKELHSLICSHLIDGNYRIYFFNYPKGSHLYSVQETQVRNLIIYDEAIDENVEAVIRNVSNGRGSVIVDAFDTAIELVNTLPEVTLESETLWKAAVKAKNKELVELLEYYFANQVKWSEERLKILNRIMDYSDGAEKLGDILQKNEEAPIVEIREYILTHFPEKIECFAGLFRLENNPLKEEELEKMAGVDNEKLLLFLPEELSEVSIAVIGKICERMAADKNAQTLLKAEKFYERVCETFAIDETAEWFVSYMLARKCSVAVLEDGIFQGIEEEELMPDIYFELVNGLPAEQITTVQMERITRLDKPGRVTMEVCRKMKQEGYIKDYLQDMVAYGEKNIELTMEELKAGLDKWGGQIYRNHPQIFMKIRNDICDKYKNEVLPFKKFFETPYPCIEKAELRAISSLPVALEVFDGAQMEEEAIETFVEYCNRQYRSSEEAFAIFKFVGRLQDNVIQEVFYKFDMKKVKFAGMSKAKKREIVELLRMPLGLTDSGTIIDFMDFTECLIPELEEEIRDDLKEEGNQALRQRYIKVIGSMSKITAETLRNIAALPYLYAYSDVINKALYEKKRYNSYVSSKILKTKQFVIEYDKLDELWSTYMRMIKSVTGYDFAKPIMEKNTDFLKLMQDRGEYKNMPEERRMIFTAIPQDEGNLENVLTYSEAFVIRYLSSIVGFQDKKAAEKFVSIMAENQKYAQKKEIYDNTHDKLENGVLKGRYTRLYQKARE